MGRRVDVAKDGSDLLPLESVRRSDKGEGGNDDLTGQIESADGEFESDCAVAHSDAVAGAG